MVMTTPNQHASPPPKTNTTSSRGSTSRSSRIWPLPEPSQAGWFAKGCFVVTRWVVFLATKTNKTTIETSWLVYLTKKNAGIELSGIHIYIYNFLRSYDKAEQPLCLDNKCLAINFVHANANTMFMMKVKMYHFPGSQWEVMISRYSLWQMYMIILVATWY